MTENNRKWGLWNSNIPSPETPTCHASAVFMNAADLQKAAAGDLDKLKGCCWDAFRLNTVKTVLGRHPSCDLTIRNPKVSGTHAKIIVNDSQYVLSDCNSLIGTYLNGKRIDRDCKLHENDLITIGFSNFLYSNGSLLYAKTDDPVYRSELLRSVLPKDRPVLEHINIHSLNREKTIEKLRDVRLDIKEGSFIAMMETHGHSALLAAMCNSSPDYNIEGSIIYRGVDLLRHNDHTFCDLAYIPYGSHIYTQLTVEDQLLRTALMYLPEDTTQQELTAYVSHTLEMLELTDAHRKIGSQLNVLERKLADIGHALVVNAGFICLGNPFHGAAPNMKQEGYRILQQLAHKYGKTVIVTDNRIPYPSEIIDLFDQFIILSDDKSSPIRLAFSGPPSKAESQFGISLSTLSGLYPDKLFKS